MPTVTVPQVNPNDEVTANSVNQGPNAIASVVNGQLDDANINTFSGTKIGAGTLPASASDINSNPETRQSETIGDIVTSGLIWSTTSGLTGTMTSGTAYINGKRLLINAIGSYTFSAAKDTYVYVDQSGSIQYNVQSNGAAQPATPTGYLPVSKLVTSSTAITSVTDLRPTIDTAAYAQITADVTSTIVTTITDVPGLSATVLVPNGGRRLRITAYQNASSGNGGYNIYIREGSTTLQTFAIPANTLMAGYISTIVNASAGSHTYTVSHSQGSAGTMTLRAAATYPAYIHVEMI